MGLIGRSLPRLSDAPTPRDLERKGSLDDRATTRRGARRPAAGAKPNVLQRERHQQDWSILVAVVGLSAIGILMVYSSSAMRAYIQQDDTLAIVGPQILWAALGLAAMLVTMRIGYRLPRRGL